MELSRRHRRGRSHLRDGNRPVHRLPIDHGDDNEKETHRRRVEAAVKYGT